MARTGLIILVMLAMTVLYLAFFRTIRAGLDGDRGIYTEDQRAEGLHCVDQLQDSPYEMRTTLEKRISGTGNISVTAIQPGPLRPDGTHKLTVRYIINRLGQVRTAEKKATGNLKNLDCSFELLTIER